MAGITEAEIVDHPIVAFVVVVVVAAAVYVAFQFAFDGRANVVEAGALALVLAGFLVGLAALRRRLG